MLSVQDTALSVLLSNGILLRNDHFVLSSGRHSDSYVDKNKLGLHPNVVQTLSLLMVSYFVENQVKVEVVAVPALGGIALGQAVTLHLNQLTVPERRRDEVVAVYAEREEQIILKATENSRVGISGGKDVQEQLNPSLQTEVGNVAAIPLVVGDELVVRRPTFTFNRGYGQVIKGKLVLVADETVTTGNTVKRVIEAIRSCGGEVVGITVLWNRGKITKEVLGVPDLFALVNLQLPKWAEGACPMCSAHVPINTEAGKGKEFLARKAAARL